MRQIEAFIIAFNLLLIINSRPTLGSQHDNFPLQRKMINKSFVHNGNKKNNLSMFFFTLYSRSTI